MSDKIKQIYEFEDFRLDAKNPSLWRGSRAVSISPKALETLIVLIENQNEIVSRDDLLDTVWKNTFVEEGNINYTISLLRKTLENKELIQTVPRRGYRFIGDVREIKNSGEKIQVPPAQDALQFLQPVALPVEPEKKSLPRRVIALVGLIAILFLTGYTFYFRGENLVSSKENLQLPKPESLQAYTRGKMILGKRSAENRTERAMDEFQNAVTLDPTFALAYAGLAESFLSMAVKAPFPKSGGYYTKAKAAAEKALTLDANLSEAYLVRGWIKRSADWDWAGAEEDLRRSLQLNSKNATAHQRMGQLLCSLGRLDEALSETKIAYELDPVSDYIVGARFPVLEARRNYDEALYEAEQLAREDKANDSALRAHATFLYHKQNYAKVIEISEEYMQKASPKAAFAWFSLMHASYQKTDQFEKAEESLKQLETLAQSDTKALYSLAMNYAELGRKDEAIANLERCFAEKEERMVWVKVEPRFENIGSDARFQELLKKINLCESIVETTD